ncbi:citrate transporter [Meredithblackwellia eburnea MCA 4105]
MSKESKPQKPAPWQSLLAGVIAGAIEGTVTYPAEFLKTRAQFAATAGEKAPGVISIARSTIQKDGFKGLYSGCGALVAGNALKAGVRFLSYDTIKARLVDSEGKLSPGRSLLAGLGAGVTEAIFAVTPSETIKTKLIDDAKKATPKYRGLINGTIGICKDEGLGGIYRGLFPTIMRQGANSAVRFSSYSTIKKLAQDYSGNKGNLGPVTTFAVGGCAGIITVYATMPLDNIKTRMQSLTAKANYRNSFHCAYRIATEEGVLAFWRGATPRLARLILSGGIVFVVYEQVIDLIV